MALEIRQHLNQELRLTQELVMTPQLQQAIKLLQLSRLELVDRIQEEMEANPLLDELKEDDAPSVETEIEAEAVARGEAEPLVPAATESPEVQPPEFDWEQYLAHYDLTPLSEGPIDRDDDRPSVESFLAPETTLHDHLLWQLRLSALEPQDQEIGVVVVGNVDDDGYLRATVEEVSEMAGAPVERVEAVLAVVQDFDPVGVASRDLRECLRRQAEEKGLGDIVRRVIEEGLRHLETKNYKRLCKELDITFEEAVDAAREISSLEPRPGRDFSTARIDYVVPDVYVSREGDEYVIRLNEEGLPRLRVSPYYQSLLQNDTPQGKEARGYIQERMQSALWLIKSIHQRQQTLYKVAQSIVTFQREFLDRGIGYLRPLILRDVAEDIGMHESTVSRVTTSKYMHTPQGTFELKFFFSSAIQRRDGEDLASRSVKARIRDIVSREEPTEPLSDLQIAEILVKEFGLKIARRTVSKYREAMGILSSSSRRRYF
ncbi:MAG: RNA polymerase factor sigma-54 [Deltaproteobacteria bacterium]|nr:RNA polymerase factor sigma-54 [Deltaproteobacteria bacterium]